MIRKQTALFVSLVILLLFGLFFFWPILEMLRGGIWHDGRLRLVFLAEVFRNPVYLEGLRNSLFLALATTAIVAAIAIPLAVLTTRYEFSGRGLMGSLILIPMILPPFVGAIGIRQIIGQYGALNAALVGLGWIDWAQAVDWIGEGRFWAVALTQSLHLYPIMYLNTAAAMANIDPAMEEAAENLGAPAWRRFVSITLPLTMPGLFAGGTIVFIWAFTELGTPLMFDYTRVAAVQIFDGIKDIGGNPFPYALAIVVLVFSTLLYALSKGLFGRRGSDTGTRVFRGSERIRLRGIANAATCMLFLLVFAMAVMPHLGVLLGSVGQGWYRSVLPSEWTTRFYSEALGHPMTLPSIRNSLRYASMAVAIDLVAGIAIAVIVVRSQLRWRGLLDALAMLPLAVPGIILAFGYVAMSRPGRVFGFLDPVNDPTVLLVIAYAVRRLPYVVRSAVAGLQQSSVTFEEAAQNLGAPAALTLRRITLPLISANLIAGGLLAFSFAMLEVSDSLMLAHRQLHFPITKALYELSQLLGDGPQLAAALGVWAMAFLSVTIIGAGMLMGKRMGAIFRI